MPQCVGMRGQCPGTSTPKCGRTGMWHSKRACWGAEAGPLEMLNRARWSSEPDGVSATAGVNGSVNAAVDPAGSWLERIWAALDGEPELTERVRLAGPPGLLPSVYDVGALATASIAAATLAVA